MYRKQGINNATVGQLKAKFGSMTVSDNTAPEGHRF